MSNIVDDDSPIRCRCPVPVVEPAREDRWCKKCRLMVEKSAIISDEDLAARLRSLERDSRQFQLRIQEFKRELEERAGAR